MIKQQYVNKMCFEAGFKNRILNVLKRKNKRTCWILSGNKCFTLWQNIIKFVVVSDSSAVNCIFV